MPQYTAAGLAAFYASTEALPFHHPITISNADGLGMLVSSAVGPGHPGRHGRVGVGARFLSLWWFARVLVCQALDEVSGASMMQTRGLEAELNPLARSLFAGAGWSGLLLFKVGVLGVTLPLLGWVAKCGRVWAARAGLVLAAGFGLLGWWSNLP
ncbi:MAG TPA: hypothetical protein VGW38_08670 [Chloroflexota bacterium]|nr:hypothetical protein [Chloroflexota bacterium]